mgnify:CR=1 FL=1
MKYLYKIEILNGILGMFFVVDVDKISIEQIFALKLVVDFIGKSAKSTNGQFVSDACFAQNVRHGGDTLVSLSPDVGHFPQSSNLFDMLAYFCRNVWEEVKKDQCFLLREGLDILYLSVVLIS